MGYKSPNFITFFCQATSTSPNDSTDYYWGSGAVAMSTAVTNRKLWIPKSGIIRILYGELISGGAGSNEATSLYIRKNNTTDTTISTTLDFSSANVLIQKSDLSISVNQGDYINLKMSTPAWAVNPTAMTFNGYMIMEVES